MSEINKKKQPVYQQIIVWALGIVGIITVIGSFISSLSTTISLINIHTASIFTLATIIFYTILIVYANTNGLKWIDNKGNPFVVRKFKPKAHIIVAVFVSLVWLPVFFSDILLPEDNNQGVTEVDRTATTKAWFAVMKFWGSQKVAIHDYKFYFNDPKVDSSIALGFNLQKDSIINTIPNYNLLNGKSLAEFYTSHINSVTRFRVEYNILTYDMSPRYWQHPERLTFRALLTHIGSELHTEIQLINDRYAGTMSPSLRKTTETIENTIININILFENDNQPITRQRIDNLETFFDIIKKETLNLQDKFEQIKSTN